MHLLNSLTSISLVVSMTFLLLLLLSSLSSSSSASSFVHAWNYTTSFKRDKRIAIVLGVFGHSEFGKTQVTIKNLLLQALPSANSVSKVIPSFTAKTWIEVRKVKSVSVAKKLKKQIEKEDSEDCADVENVDLEEMSTPMKHYLKYLTAPPLEDEQDLKATVTFTVKEAGLYALVFARCIAPAKTVKVVSSSSLVKVSQYNPKYDKNSGGGIDVGSTFLSIGETPLPMIYGGFALIFSVGTFFWYRELTAASESGSGGVMRVHYAMFIVGILKSLTLFLEAGVFAHRNNTGGTGAFVDVIFVIVAAVKTAILFVIVILLGTGWSISKAFISEKEQKLILGVLIIQFIVNVALATLEEGSPVGADKVEKIRIGLRVLDLICALLILVPIISRAKTQHEATVHRETTQAMNDSDADNNNNNNEEGSSFLETPEKITITTTPSNSTNRSNNNTKNGTSSTNDADDQQQEKEDKEMLRLKTFRSFYIATFVFLYFTRLVVPYMEAHLSYLFLWIPHLMYEVAALVFYYISCSLFHPSASSDSNKKIVVGSNNKKKPVVATTMKKGNPNELEEVELD